MTLPVDVVDGPQVLAVMDALMRHKRLTVGMTQFVGWSSLEAIRQHGFDRALRLAKDAARTGQTLEQISRAAALLMGHL